MRLTNRKHLFDIPEDVTYLNIASLSPSFKAIEEAGIQSVLKKNRPYLTTSADFFNPVIEMRELFSKLIDTVFNRFRQTQCWFLNSELYNGV